MYGEAVVKEIRTLRKIIVFDYGQVDEIEVFATAQLRAYLRENR